MQKIHYFILASIITMMYWVLDAYHNSSIYDSSFIEELLLQTPHTLVFLKLFTAAILFALTFAPLLFKSRTHHKHTKESLNEFGELQRISDILFSSLSTKMNVIKALELIEKTFHLEASLLFLYKKDTLSLYNENEFIKASFRSKEILPFQVNASRSGVEEIAISCFIEKRPFSEDKLKIDKKQITLFSFILKEEQSSTIIGNLMLATTDAHFVENNLQMIEKITKMLTFVLSLSFKIELLQNMNDQHTNENQSFDTVLNIMNTLKFQEHLTYEFKRHQRYRTSLTMVIININMFENLSKVFPAETITALKKDFIQFVKKNIRDVDLFGKWGNDQYALLLPDVEFNAGVGLAKKLQRLLEVTKFQRIGKISCSYGITSLAAKDTIGGFKARAEGALLRASIHEGNAIDVKLQNVELNQDTF